MSQSKPLTTARLTDLILGSLGNLPSSETLEHLVRYLGTWSGSDKLFMVVQYAIKLIIPLLHLRARLRHRAGFAKVPSSAAAHGLAKFEAAISSSRTLWRLWGLLPIFQWMISLEKNPQPTKALLNIERLQAWSMIGYYPLEHLAYLCNQGVVPSSITLPLSGKPITLNTGAMGMWSCRFWALYVLLQLTHVREDRKLLQRRQRDLKKAKVIPTATERQEIQNRWDALWNEVVVNLGNLPLALHWSTESGLIKNDVWVSIFGLVAAVASFRSGWRATARPSSPLPIDKAEVVDPPAAELTPVTVVVSSPESIDM